MVYHTKSSSSSPSVFPLVQIRSASLISTTSISGMAYGFRLKSGAVMFSFFIFEIVFFDFDIIANV